MVKNLPRKSQLNCKLITLAVAACFATGGAYANPTVPSVVNGSAAILQSGNLLQITNSPKAIINWGSFSIGGDERKVAAVLRGDVALIHEAARAGDLGELQPSREEVSIGEIKA